MAYCSYCAAALVPDQPVCARCGRPAPVEPASVAVAPNVARPPSILLAITLLLICCAINLLSFATIFFTYRRSIGIDARSIAPLVLWIVFVIFLWQRQSWARIAILLLLAWSIGNLALVFLRIPASSAVIWSFAVPIAVNVLRVCAAYLMFTPASNAWFKK
jgi:hypothetical protein